jgi:hypothetical protein
MLAIQSTIGIQIGNFKGQAEGPLAIGAFLAIVLVLLLRKRRPGA